MQEFSWGEARTVILTNVSEMIKLNMYIIVISIMLCSFYCSEVATLLHQAGKIIAKIISPKVASNQ